MMMAMALVVDVVVVVVVGVSGGGGDGHGNHDGDCGGDDAAGVCCNACDYGNGEGGAKEVDQHVSAYLFV